jgi:hypothetical protein
VRSERPSTARHSDTHTRARARARTHTLTAAAYCLPLLHHRQLGRGAFGRVLLARLRHGVRPSWRLAHERHFAVKILPKVQERRESRWRAVREPLSYTNGRSGPKSALASRYTRAQAVQEQALLRRLRHPFLVQVRAVREPLESR